MSAMLTKPGPIIPTLFTRTPISWFSDLTFLTALDTPSVSVKSATTVRVSTPCLSLISLAVFSSSCLFLLTRMMLRPASARAREYSLPIP